MPRRKLVKCAPVVDRMVVLLAELTQVMVEMFPRDAAPFLAD